MTQQDKCDVCRRRKVKCDEKRPTCGQCRKKNRPCAYEYSKTSRFSDVRTDGTGTSRAELALRNTQDERLVSLNTKAKTLMIRSVKEARFGEGVFHTFSTVSTSRCRTGNCRPNGRSLSNPQSPGIPRPMFSREVYLCAGFSQLLGENGANWNSTFLWGCWISSVPARLGTNPALDDAADCFISANAAYHCKRGISDAVTSRKYSAALVSLQNVLSSDDDTKFATETLAAVNVLLLFEQVFAFREMRWQSHYKGLIVLLLARGPQLKADDMSRSLFYAALNHDFSEAIFGGCRSTFDSNEWLDLPPPENSERRCEDFTCISTEIARHMIQLPRLVTLVRQVHRDPFHVDASIEALSLAQHLYCRYSEIIAPRIDAALIKRTVSVDTLDEELAKYCPKSLEFEWFNIFEGLIRCFYVRILVLHLCLTLRITFPLSPNLQAANLEEEEGQCAALIAASVQYAEKQEPFLLSALVMRLPLQVSYGTWWRRMAHDSMKQDQVREGEEAIFMEQWCAQKANVFIEALNGSHVSKNKLQAMYVAVAEGGPWEICKQKGPLV